MAELIGGTTIAGYTALHTNNLATYLPTSLPASDVYAWAKSPTKPTYLWNEIEYTPTVLSYFTNDITGLYIQDNRGVDRQPTYYSGHYLNTFFNEMIPGTNSNDWKSGINVAGWDQINYNTWQLIGGSTNVSNGEWYFREGVGTFGNVKRIWHSDNFNPTAIPEQSNANTTVISLTSQYTEGLKHQSILDSSNNTLNANLLYGGSFNDYGIGLSKVNYPIGFSFGSFFNFMSAYSNQLSLQFANDINHNVTNSTKDLWFRSSNNLGFQNDWKKVWHDGNLDPTAIPNQTNSTLISNLNANYLGKKDMYDSSYGLGNPFATLGTGANTGVVGTLNDWDYRSFLTVRGENTGTNWQLIGSAGTTPYGEWYLRDGISTWGRSNRIWHDGNLTPSDYVKWEHPQTWISQIHAPGQDFKILSGDGNHTFFIGYSGEFQYDYNNIFHAGTGIVSTYLYVANNSAVGNQILFNATGPYFGSIQTLGSQSWGLGIGTGSMDTTIGNTALSWNSAGNVGIGITNSTVNGLEICKYPNYGIESLTTNNISDGTSWNVNGQLKISTTNAGNGIVIGASATANDRKSWIQSGHPDPIYSGYVGSLCLNPFGGNVLIGATNGDSDAKLTVMGGDIQVDRSYRFRFSAGPGYPRSSIGSNTNNDIVFYVGVDSEVARLTNAGNFLIGTTTSDYNEKLEIEGAIALKNSNQVTFYQTDRIAVYNNTFQIVTNGSNLILDTLGSSLGEVQIRTNSGGLGYQNVASSKYVQSRGQNLLTNGTGLLGSNYNWSQFIFDGSQAFGSNGSFRFYGNGEPSTDELMPVDTTLEYKFNFYAKTLLGVGHYFAFCDMYDVDGLQINSTQHMYFANTLTTLSQALNNGDTIVHLNSAANWYNTPSSDTYNASFIVWNYVNSFGYNYPALTYSRNWYEDLWNAGGINYSNNTITLKNPWSYGNLPAGTQLSNGSAGGTFKYFALCYTVVPTTWTNYSGTMTGTDYTGTNDSTKFSPGTASCKIGFLMDYSDSAPFDTIYLSNLTFGQTTDFSIYQPLSTAINTGNIGSQSVAYANALSSNNGKTGKETRLYRYDGGELDYGWYICSVWNSSNGWRLTGYNDIGDEEANIHKVTVNHSDDSDYADYATSAGNSTTFNGYHSTDFAGFVGSVTDIHNFDIPNSLGYGFFSSCPNPINSPVGGTWIQGIMFPSASNSSYKSILAWDNDHMHLGNQHADTWAPWLTLYDSGNSNNSSVDWNANVLNANVLNVNSTSTQNLVTNLNAEFLNGKDYTWFYQEGRALYLNENANNVGSGYYFNETGNGTGNSNFPDIYGELLSFDIGYGKAQFHLNSSNDLKVRNYWGGTWSPWNTIWTDANFTPSNYLPLAGGQMTGVLQLVSNPTDWTYLNNPGQSGGLRLATGDGSGNLQVGIEITSGGNRVKVNHPLQITGSNSTNSSNSIFSIQKLNENYGLFAGVRANGNSFIQIGYSDDSIHYNLELNPNGGNVGIGTTNPGARLQVYAPNVAYTAAGQLFVTASDEGVDTGGQISLGGKSTTYGQNFPWANIAGRSEVGDSMALAGYLQFSVMNPSGGNVMERMRITSAGNVGIGTTAPRGTLDVGGAASVSSKLVFGFGSENLPPLTFSNTRRANYADVFIGKNLSGVDGNDTYITTNTSGGGYSGAEFRYGGDILFFNSAAATVANTVVTPATSLTIKGSGNVLIGTSTDNGAKLQVNGTISVIEDPTTALQVATKQYVDNNSLWELRDRNYTVVLSILDISNEERPSIVTINITRNPFNLGDTATVIYGDNAYDFTIMSAINSNSIDIDFNDDSIAADFRLHWSGSYIESYDIDLVPRPKLTLPYSLILSTDVDGFQDALNAKVSIPTYNLTINKLDLVWLNGWAKINAINNINAYEIKVSYLAIDSKLLKPIISYPSNSTYNGNSTFSSGFLLRDVDGLLREDTDFDTLEISFDIIPSTITRYNNLVYESGEGVVFNENDGGHSYNSVTTFNEVFNHINSTNSLSLTVVSQVQTVLDSLANHNQLAANYRETYLQNNNANLLLTPYEDEGALEQGGSNANTLNVSSHYGNTYSRHDNGFTSSTQFFSNVILVGSRPDDTTSTQGTSYGYGMEFFEMGNNTNLSSQYPDKVTDIVLGFDVTTNGTTVTTASGDFTTCFRAGDTIIIAGNIVNNAQVNGERKIVDHVVDAHNLVITTACTVNYTTPQWYSIRGDIGQLWQVNLTRSNEYYQSPVTAIVGAKLKLIKLATGANWHIVRKAARATALKDGRGTVGQWDMYRGFGVINVVNAITWINSNYKSDSYRVMLADQLDGVSNISPFLTYTDLLPNSPVPKRLLDNKLSNRESLTYSELYTLKTNNNLVVGQIYIINDYQTVHTITNTSDTNVGIIEPLLVTALTSNKLSNECYSNSFPQDIIYYNIENDQNMVAGCTKGYIYRRIDTLKNNDIPFDFRNVKFRRWQIEVTTSHVNGNDSSFNLSSVVLQTGTDNIYLKISNTQAAFSDTGKWKLFEWKNMTYTSPVTDNWNLDENYFNIPVNTGNYFDYYLFSTVPTLLGNQSSYDNIYKNKFDVNNNYIIDNSNNVFFGNYFYYNTIGTNFNFNTIGDYFIYNTIGIGFNSNTIGNSFSFNTIGNNFNSNTIGNNFSSNIIGNNFSSNAIGDYFYSNTIVDYFNYNTIGVNFYSNTIGYGFNANTIGNDLTSNRIGDFFGSNIIGDGFNTNTIGYYFNYNNGMDFTYSTYVYMNFNKELFTTQGWIQNLKYYDDTNTLIILPANT